MISFESGGCLLESQDELPAVPQRIKRLYGDFETSSGNPKLDSKNPWFNCKAIGASVAFEDGPTWFVPRWLLMTGWWRDCLDATKRGHGHWVNHNVKYDMHVSANDLGVIPECDVECTLNSSKLIDSDLTYHGGFGLDNLSKIWLGHDIMPHYERMLPYLNSRQKDYGMVPLDILAEYGCVDTQVVQRLRAHVQGKLHEESLDVFNTERRITHLLFEMERNGITVDPIQLQIKQVHVLVRMLQLEAELKDLTGREFRPHVNEDVYDVLCNQYGLPVLVWTQAGDEDDETGEVVTRGGPSFNKAALAMYRVHPQAPPGLVERIQEYRTLNTFNSLFLNKWDLLNIDGVMHPIYNQAVRTGRMSCSSPNMQQLSLMAKELIIPPPGMSIVSADLSQIEFRMIVHYLENRRCIAAFNKSPWTDFHLWVAKSVPTKRKPAKTLNFMLGYGGGKKKTVATLSVNKDLVGEIIERVKNDAGIPEDLKQRAIAQACEDRALKVYNGYHALLPELKPTSKQAMNSCMRKGYVRNHYGRHRHMSPDASWAAFNSACQSSAGDLFKERMVALRDEVPELIQIAQVHDQVVGLLPTELLRRESYMAGGCDRTLRRITTVMNTPTRPLKVPVRTSIGWSERNWAEAQSDECEQKF